MYQIPELIITIIIIPPIHSITSQIFMRHFRAVCKALTSALTEPTVQNRMANFFCKGLISKYFKLGGYTVSVTTTHVCHCRERAAIDNGCGCVSINFIYKNGKWARFGPRAIVGLLLILRELQGGKIQQWSNMLNVLMSYVLGVSWQLGTSTPICGWEPQPSVDFLYGSRLKLTKRNSCEIRKAKEKQRLLP